MNRFEDAFEKINEFYKIKPSENFKEEIFNVLSQIIKFETGGIIFSNTQKPEYLYKTTNLDFKGEKVKYLKENLNFKEITFGTIIISGKSFTDVDKKIFATCSTIISDLIKDYEMSNIAKTQIHELQQGYLKINKKDIKRTKFISHISHELRTPINSILGFSDILNGEFTGKLTEKQKEYINDIKISALRLLEMVNEILDISKIEAKALKLNLQEFETLSCIKEVINIINPLLMQKNLAFTTDIENFKFVADYPKFQQILLNLLSNAIKYTNENGKIHLSCKKLEDNKTELCIEDNGIGIAKKDLKKIFKKYEQSGKIQNNSTGLGLAITKELVKLHKGKILIESEIDKGSKFTVIIP